MVSADNPTFRKRVAPRLLPTFGELVTQYGDSWVAFVPYEMKGARDPLSPDDNDAMLMRLMEKGKLGRILP